MNKIITCVLGLLLLASPALAQTGVKTSAMTSQTNPADTDFLRGYRPGTPNIDSRFSIGNIWDNLYKGKADALYASKPWFDGAAAQGTIIKFYGPTVANGGHGTYTALQGGDFDGTEGSGILWRLPLTHPASSVTALINTDSNGNMGITSVTGNSKYVGTNADGTYGVFDLPTPTQASLNVDDLITLSGVADGSVNLGQFTGTTIADNQTIKAALQALETALEGISTSGISDLDDLPGDTVDDNLIDVGLIADLGPMIHNKTSKTTPVDADIIPLSDSAASWLLKGLSWTNLKATLKTYFDTIYTALAGTSSNTFQIGTSGPKLKNNSGTIEARNAADDAYADIKGKDAYFAHIYSTGADGTYYGNNDNTVAITFTPAQGDFWSESGVPYFRDATTSRKMLHAGSSAADFPTLNQNTTGTAAGLGAQYIDWNASSGGASIANKPTLPTAAAASDINTGTETGKYVTPDALAGSNLGIKEIGWTIKDSDVATAVADGKQAFVVPAAWNGMNLVDLTCAVADLNSAASGATTVVLRRVRGATAVDMTSTGVTINYDEYSASDETVDTANDDIQTGDKIYVDVNAVTSPAHKGLSCTASFQLP